MNISRPSAFKLGFTLVELLTVIAIIGILAAMLLTVLPAVMKNAKIKKATLEMVDIVNDIQSYDLDNGRFPVTKAEQATAGPNDFTTGLIGFGLGTSGAGTGFSSDNNSNVVAILMDLTIYPNGTPTANTNHVYNAKRVPYLNAKMSGYDPATNDPNPPGGVDNSGVYRDPWGNPYIITMNTSYNDQGTSDLLYSLNSVSSNGSQTGLNGLFNPTYSTNPNNFLYHGKVMVWSAGPDKKYGPVPANSGVNKDNVISWK